MTAHLGKPFRTALLSWYETSRRDLPWRRTSDPYRIWISEVMLQQTRAAAAIPYYESFLARFPDLEALAQAGEAEVLRQWSGLGYYSRARNLHRAARQIAGQFPSTYDGIRSLPGIGDYTAAAVSSIAFQLPHAALDGNVARVLARLLPHEGDIGSARVRSELRAAADELLDRKNPGVYNQAVMELGATVCLPRAPRCTLCPVAGFCRAREEGRERELPVKLRKAEPVSIESALALVRKSGKVLLWQRKPEAKRLAGFWELPETNGLPGFQPGEVLGSFRHSITHHRYRITVISGRVTGTPMGFQWFSEDAMGAIALSTTARKALRISTKNRQ